MYVFRVFRVLLFFEFYHDLPVFAIEYGQIRRQHAFKEDERAALEAGMQAHIAKSVDVNQLMKTLASVLQMPADKNGE